MPTISVPVIWLEYAGSFKDFAGGVCDAEVNGINAVCEVLVNAGGEIEILRVLAGFLTEGAGDNVASK